jgi:hypothetical protein
MTPATTTKAPLQQAGRVFEQLAEFPNLPSPHRQFFRGSLREVFELKLEALFNDRDASVEVRVLSLPAPALNNVIKANNFSHDMSA